MFKIFSKLNSRYIVEKNTNLFIIYNNSDNYNVALTELRNLCLIACFLIMNFQCLLVDSLKNI